MTKGTGTIRSTTLRKKSQKGNLANKSTQNSAFRKTNSSQNPNRPDKDKGKGFFRSKATIKRLNMYRDKPDLEQMRKIPTDPKAGRIEPDRRWFGNTRQLD